MSIPAAQHTPLESLFLFQSLLTTGVDDDAFARISGLLKNNALIKSGGTYDPARLNPDALKALFLGHFGDELRSGETAAGVAAAGVAGVAGMVTATLKDVYDNVERLPGLVDRLYARYRDSMVNSIREDERKFANLQKEIQLLERSEKERLAKVAASQDGAPRDGKTTAGAASPSPSPSQLQGPGGSAAPGAARRGTAPTTPVLPPKVAPATPHLPPGAHPHPPRTTASPKPPHGVASVLQAPAGAPTPQPGPRVLQAPAQSPKHMISPRPENAVPPPKDGAAGPLSPAGTLKWEKPYQPPPPTIQAPPQAGQFTPTIPPNAPVHQKIQQQQQQQTWPQQQQAQFPAQQQQQPHYAPSPPGQAAQVQQTQARPGPTKLGLVPPQQAAQLVPPFQPGTRSVGSPQARPQSTAQGRPIQPQQSLQSSQNQRPSPIQAAQQQHVPQMPKPPLSQLAQKFQQSKSPAPRPLTVATSVKVGPGHGASSAQGAKGTPGSLTPQRWSQGVPPQQGSHAHGSPSTPASALSKDKSYASSYAGQQPRPALPEHMIRQAVTPGPARRMSAASPALRTPAPSSPVSVKRGFGTKWATYSTPSTPDPTVSEPQSPAFEPVSPPQRSAALKHSSMSKPVPASQIAKPAPKGDVTPVSKPGRGRPRGTVQRGRGTSATPSLTGTGTGTRRSQSVTSQTDELSLGHSVHTHAKVKKEAAATPRLWEETADTTTDESGHGRGILVTPGSISRVPKRKRPDPVDLSGPPTHVLWTRGFTKVSSSALDQISSHRDANMFATALRERDAPNYRQIVLQPQDITSIRSAIKQGNKAAQQAANVLPGGDPGTAAVWLPISEDLTPPRGIINSAHLERELVHMFCNAIMYNPDPDRGPGPAFLKRARNDEEEVVGYRLDENGVVKNTRSMFIEVEKLLGDLRAAEKERGIPPISTTRQGSVVTPADDTAEEEDELAGDGGDAVSVLGTVKRRRINTRS